MDATAAKETKLTDAYIDIKLDDDLIWHTPIIMNTSNPTWNEAYRIDICPV